MCILELLLALIKTILCNTAVTELQIICMCLVSEIQKLGNFQAVEKHQFLYLYTIYSSLHRFCICESQVPL